MRFVHDRSPGLATAALLRRMSLVYKWICDVVDHKVNAIIHCIRIKIKSSLLRETGKQYELHLPALLNYSRDTSNQQYRW